MRTRIILLLYATLLLFEQQVQAQCFNTAWQSPSSLTNDNSIGVYDYSFPVNAQNSDNSRASANSLISILSGNTYYLKATGFNFSIPSYASICGIMVEIESRATGLLLTAAVRDNDIRLVKNNVVTGTNHAMGGDWNATDNYRTYGSNSDLWGTTLTANDVNAPGFGIAISARIIALIAALPSADIDHIRMSVVYNPILPVTLAYFQASRDKENVKLDWKTTEEEDGAQLVLQRSINNERWEDLQLYEMSMLNVNKTYSYTDLPGANGNYRYRLETRYLNGTTSYSATKYIKFTGNNGLLHFFPNPARDRITVNSDQPVLKNIYGRELTVPIQRNGKSAEVDIRALPPGVYFISNGISTAKLIKQ